MVQHHSPVTEADWKAYFESLKTPQVFTIAENFHVWCIVAIDAEGTDTPRRFFGSDEARKELALCRDAYEGLNFCELSDISIDALTVKRFRQPSNQATVVTLKVTTFSLIDALNIALNEQWAIMPTDYI